MTKSKGCAQNVGLFFFSPLICNQFNLRLGQFYEVTNISTDTINQLPTSICGSTVSIHFITPSCIDTSPTPQKEMRHIKMPKQLLQLCHVFFRFFMILDPLTRFHYETTAPVTTSIYSNFFIFVIFSSLPFCST